MNFKGMKLVAEPWGDGSSSIGFVNINCPDLEVVVAKDVEEEIAQELCRRWNECVDSTREGSEIGKS